MGPSPSKEATKEKERLQAALEEKRRESERLEREKCHEQAQVAAAKKEQKRIEEELRRKEEEIEQERRERELREQKEQDEKLRRELAPFYGEPWIELPDVPDWNEETYNSLLQSVLDYTPLQKFHGSEVTISHSNILLIGQIQAGKSSFFNTIDTAIIDQISRRAKVIKEGTSATNKFQPFEFYGPHKEVLKFRVFDVRGLEETNSLQLKDIEMILDGRIKDGYEFDVNQPITKGNRYFRGNPTISDKTHCVVYCIDDNYAKLSKEVLDQLHDVRALVKRKGASEMLLLSKVDNLQERIEKEIPLIFRSKDVHRSVKEISEYMGFPTGCVLPMKNYSQEQYVSTHVNILALRNMLQILKACDDNLAKLKKEDYWRKEGLQIVRGEKLKEDEEFILNYKTVGEDLKILFIGTKSADIPGVFVALESFLSRRIAKRGTFGGNIDELTLKEMPRLNPRSNLASAKKEAKGTSQGIPIRLFALTGVDDMSYLKDELLEDVLDGNVASGTKLQYHKRQSSFRVCGAPHAVVYCIDATMAMEDITRQYGKINQVLRQRDACQLGIVTNISKLGPAIQPDTMFTSDDVQFYIQELADTLQLDITSIFPIFTYKDEREVNDTFSAIVADAFRNIVETADAYKKNEPSSSILKGLTNPVSLLVVSLMIPAIAAFVYYLY